MFEAGLVSDFFSVGSLPLKFTSSSSVIPKCFATLLRAVTESSLSPLSILERYEYNTNSNKLKRVTDDGNDKDSKLGDFKYDPATKTSVDYSYDVNGNLTNDNNKGITSINYNYLNLPQTITIPGKGSIDYVYDAAGNKLKKVVHETGKPDKTTLYLFGIYEDDVLQFLPQEEGRIRPLRDAGNNITGFTYDYFIKDHLGNVRMVLTEEQKTDAYPVASMETAQVSNEKLYYSKIDETRELKPSGYPADAYTTPNDYAAKVRGDGNKIGPGIVLKVMAGDKFNLRVNSWYKLNGSTPGTPVSPLNDLLAALAGGVGNISGTHGGATVTEITNSGVLTPGVTDFLGDQPVGTGKPKAYVNWILLDEQFKIAKDASGNIIASGFSGADPVGSDMEFKPHVFSDMPINKSGYLYVYVSNETPNIDVFFDNLQVTHIRGPILEETHYYPFGLTMSGISSKALSFGSPENKIKFQGQEFASKEFSDGSGLEMYEFKWRMHDPQIGRFWQVDPLADKYVYNSTYAFSENKVINHVELEGLEANPLPNFFRAVQDEFISLGKQLDHMFSKIYTNDHILSTDKNSKEIEVKKSVETSTTFRLDFGAENWMSHVVHTNSNVGAPPLKLEIDKKTEISDKTTTTTKAGGLKIVGTQSVSRTDGSVTTGVTVSGPVKLGVIPNATVSFGLTSNGNGTTTTSANLSGSGNINKTTYTGGTSLLLTGQSGNRANTQFGFSIFGQSSSGKDVNTTTFKITW